MNEQLLEIVDQILDDTISTHELQTKLLSLSVLDLAEIIMNLDDPKKELTTIRLLKKDVSADVFAYLDSEIQEKVLGSLTNAETAYLIDKLYADDATDILDEMPSDIVIKVLNNADSEKRKTINELLNYSENSAGSIMTTEYISLDRDMTIRQAFSHIREVGLDKETIYTCYVTNKGNLIGVVTAKQLIMADIDDTIENIMSSPVICVNTQDDREDVAERFKKYDFLAMPVVDKDNALVGIITVDDIMDVLHDEHTEDILKQAAIMPSERPYLKTSVWGLAIKRIFWLVLLLSLGFISGGIMQSFEDVLTKITILAASIPMLMGTGGNSGSQSSTLVIRSLVLGEIKNKDTLKIFLKEMCVGIICGLCLAPLCFLKVILIDSKLYLGQPLPSDIIMTAVTVSLALICTIVIAKSIGCLLPIVAKKFKLDPAVMAAPLITSIVDISALFVYFGFAILFLL